MSVKRALLSSVVALAACPLAFAGGYRLEKTHADLLFSVDHAGFTQKHGQFRDFDATLQFDAEHVADSKVSVTVKTASIDTGLEQRDGDLKGPQFLDVAKYPEMTFVSTKVTPGAGGALVIEGELTLHGTTRPVTLEARLNKAAPNPFSKKPTVGFSATGALKRSDFGITTFVPIIGDTITLAIDAEFGLEP